MIVYKLTYANYNGQLYDIVKSLIELVIGLNKFAGVQINREIFDNNPYHPFTSIC